MLWASLDFDGRFDHSRHMSDKRLVKIILGNREEHLNDMHEVVIQSIRPDINFKFTRTARVDVLIQIASDSRPDLIIFMPSGNLEPDPARPSVTPQEAAVFIVKTIKAKHPIPVICIAMQSEAKASVLAAGADLFLDATAGRAEIVSAVASCLKL